MHSGDFEIVELIHETNFLQHHQLFSGSSQVPPAHDWIPMGPSPCVTRASEEQPPARTPEVDIT